MDLLVAAAGTETLGAHAEVAADLPAVPPQRTLFRPVLVPMGEPASGERKQRTGREREHAIR
jgi:hypothetical protein